MGLPTRQPPRQASSSESECHERGSVTQPEVQSGLEGVVAFATEIAEPDKEGGALRYRGVDIEDLVGAVPYEQVWGLLVDGHFKPGLPPAEPHALTVRSGDPRVDVQSALAMLAPEWGFGQLIDISDEEARDNLARASVMALSFVAQSARGAGQPPVPQREVDEGRTIPERFLIRWRGEANPDHVKAIDAYWISAAEHGMNASTFTARVVASTGADVAAALSGAVGALSGPLHGGAPSRVLKMLDEVEAMGDAERWVSEALDRGERLMGFGHRIYRAEDPRARVLRRTCRELGSPRFEAAEALEKAALAELQARRPDRVLATNVEFWSAVVLDLAEVPPELFTPMFTCARVAGWSAHILEQKREAQADPSHRRSTSARARGRRTRCERVSCRVAGRSANADAMRSGCLALAIATGDPRYRDEPRRDSCTPACDRLPSRRRTDRQRSPCLPAAAVQSSRGRRHATAGERDADIAVRRARPAPDLEGRLSSQRDSASWSADAP